MPLIILIIYFPIYGFCTVIGIIIGSRIGKKAHKVLLNKKHYTYMLIGFIFSTTFSLISIYEVIRFQGDPWNALLIILAITILGPFSIGSCILLLFSFFKKETSLAILRSISAGAFLSITAVLAFTILGFYYAEKQIITLKFLYHNIANHSTFSEVCKNARIEIIEDVAPAKSIALLPDSFVHTNSGVTPSRLSSWKLPSYNNRLAYGKRTNIGKYSLRLSILDYIERPPPKESSLYGDFKYERLSIIGERILKRQYSAYAKREYTKYDRSPASTITAEYNVIPSYLEMPLKKDKGIMGERIEIRKNSNNELIAYAQYYYDLRAYNVCPETADDPFFVYNFIATALKVDNPNRNSNILKDNKQ
jgi:hypothetical protein